MKFSFLLIPFFLLITSCRHNKDSEKDKSELTEEQVINIANKIITSEGFSLNEMICKGIDNEKWKYDFESLKTDYPDKDFYKRYEKLLKGRSYYAVYYVPDPKKIMAGAIYVFIDKNTGEVIGFCGGL